MDISNFLTHQEIMSTRLSCLAFAIELAKGSRWSGDVVIEAASDMADFVLGIKSEVIPFTPKFMD